jgi:hypothetical protein
MNANSPFKPDIDEIEMFIGYNLQCKKDIGFAKLFICIARNGFNIVGYMQYFKIRMVKYKLDGIFIF